MWLLPTRGRPELCQQVLDACIITGMSTPGCILVDTRDERYPNLRHGDNWFITEQPLDMAEAMEWCFHTFPEEKFYGWMSDDLVPRTSRWDQQLVHAADRWFMTHCNDLHLSLHHNIMIGVLSGAMCWGGELVREVGWWALPGVKQGGIDDAWVHLFGRLFGLKRYLDDVVVEHITYLNAKRPRDKTDNRTREGIAYIEQDLQLYHQWKGGPEPQAIVDRVRYRMIAEGYDLSRKEFIPLLP